MTSPWLLWRAALAVCLILSGCGTSPDASNDKRHALSSSVVPFETKSGKMISVEKGTFDVPLNYDTEDSARISLPFYRLRAENETGAAPIFLLAGGPGSSWVERFEDNEERQQEVFFYRQFADVVVFDQRGGGTSRPEFTCNQRDRLPTEIPLTEAALFAAQTKLAKACKQTFDERGIDLRGLNTHHNARDVDALRQALHYQKITLIGGSYGSHLALHIMRMNPEVVDRAVMFGVEGPDHTYDDPGGSLNTLQRIAATAENSPELGPYIPGIGLIGALQDVQHRLEQEPVIVPVEIQGRSFDVAIGKYDVQRLARVRAGQKSRPNFWPELILDLYNGDYSMAAYGALQLRDVRIQDPMHYMMDCASGITNERREWYRQHAARQVLGDLNSEYEELCSVWEAPDLGDGFRAPVRSEIPVLLIHGTWDTSTPIENAREVVSTLPNGHLVEVVGGNHGALYNLYVHWKPMEGKMKTFLIDRRIDFPDSVILDPVDYNPPSD